MNHVLHIAAIVQLRHDTEGRAYYRRKLTAGKTPREALRCLKRRLSDVIYRRLVTDAQRHHQADAEAGPGGHCGASQESSAVDLPPAHRHFGSATSRTRPTDATTAVTSPEALANKGSSDDPLT